MEENQKIPMRSQVKKEDTWAIEDMYATVEDWEKDFAAAKKVAEEAAEYAGRLGESAQALYDWSALTEKLDCMLSEIYGYASRVKDQDTADAAGQTLSARAMGLYVECSGLISFADPEILSIPEEKLEAFYAEKPELLKYRRSINEVRRCKDHILSPELEKILADAGEMAQAPGSMAVPVCQGKKGHPVMLSKEVFGHILTYRGGKGLRGAMDAWGEGVREIAGEDPGVLLDTNTKMDYESLLAYEKDRQKRGELAFQASISLSREEECFSALTADFLEAVAESGSMLGACQIRDISYSKGWKMLKIAEAQLGIQFLERQTGGSKGGFSVLTPEGKVFLEKFRRMEAAVQAAAEAAFEKIFLEPEEEEKEDTDGREINAF